MQIKRKIKVVETAPCGQAMLVLEPEPFLLNKKSRIHRHTKTIITPTLGVGGGVLYNSRLMIITVKTYNVKYVSLY
jgi:hypothetical protein